MHIGDHTINAVTIAEKFFIAKLVVNDEVNHERRADTYGQPGDINSSEDFVLPETPECYGKKVLEHTQSLRSTN
jgi:hypothetical protein